VAIGFDLFEADMFAERHDEVDGLFAARPAKRLALAIGGLTLIALGIALILHSIRRFVDAGVQKGYVSGELMWFATGIEATLSLLLGVGLLVAGIMAVRARPTVAAVALASEAVVCLGVTLWLTTGNHLDSAFWPGVVAAIAFGSLIVWLLASMVASPEPT